MNDTKDYLKWYLSNQSVKWSHVVSGCSDGQNNLPWYSLDLLKIQFVMASGLKSYCGKLEPTLTAGTVIGDLMWDFMSKSSLCCQGVFACMSALRAIIGFRVRWEHPADNKVFIDGGSLWSCVRLSHWLIYLYWQANFGSAWWVIVF